MPRVAFYRVLTDVTELQLPSGEGSHPLSRELNFEVTGDIELHESDLRPMLCFQMDPNNSADLKLEVFIRDEQGADRKICSWHLVGGGSRWTMEPLKSEWVRGKVVDNKNKIIFRVNKEGK